MNTLTSGAIFIVIACFLLGLSIDGCGVGENRNHLREIANDDGETDDDVVDDDDDNDNNNDDNDNDNNDNNDDNDNNDNDDLSWSVMSGVYDLLYGVGGRGHNNIFAVGWNIYQYDGLAWDNTIGVPENFTGYAAWCDLQNQAFAAGDGGSGGDVILRFTGGSWTSMAINGLPQNLTTPLSGLWGASVSDVFAVGGLRTYPAGGYGNIAHFDGETWTGQVDYLHMLFDIWGSSSSDVFAVGGLGTNAYVTAVLHYDGRRWAAMPSATVLDYVLNSVWGASATDVFAAGGNVFGTSSVVMHYDGSSWAILTTVTPLINGLWGSSSTDVFAVGFADEATGAILHYDGSSWSPMAGGSFPLLNGVWGAGPGDVFAVGFDAFSDAGVILHYGAPQ